MSDPLTGRALLDGREVALVRHEDGALTTATGEPVRPEGLRWLPPVDPCTIIAIALNYRDHAAELDLAEPQQPALFPKFANATIGHLEPIVRPRGIRYMHYETELAVVIGRPARRVRSEDALGHVAGYTIANDLVVRDFVIDHFRPPIKPKNFDTFLPMGPFLVPASRVPDPQDLKIRTYVDGELRQEGNTRDMVHSVADLIAYVSEFMTLRPGDVLLTGTPKGISHVHAGDRLRCEVGDFPPLENPVVAEEDLGAAAASAEAAA
ncbi:MAG TPA: fumarylacetoacetate hydrolase family protein [Trueperaceae bacterium]|nr:fumarylacetoacetate hydrolase family protein [Trueperaceae bacterium]